jgi:hypothetical protein
MISGGLQVLEIIEVFDPAQNRCKIRHLAGTQYFQGLTKACKINGLRSSTGVAASLRAIPLKSQGFCFLRNKPCNSNGLNLLSRLCNQISDLHVSFFVCWVTVYPNFLMLSSTFLSLTLLNFWILQ